MFMKKSENSVKRHFFMNHKMSHKHVANDEIFNYFKFLIHFVKLGVMIIPLL